MKTSNLISSMSSLKTSIFYGAFMAAVFLTPFGGHAETAPYWVEGESFTRVSGNPDLAISPNKAPASGGASTAGAAFINSGDEIVYELSLDRSILNAKIVVRYARRHFRSTMQPVDLGVEVVNNGKKLQSTIVCGDTKGWGTAHAKEWHFIEKALGEDLSPGSLTVRFFVNEDNSNVNIDGFFLAPASFVISNEETKELERIQISDTGYFGLVIAGDTVFPGALDTFRVVGRGFVDAETTVRFELEDEDAKIVSLHDPVNLKLSAEPKSIEISASVFDQSEDGAYRLKISTNEQADVLTHPISVMRELVVHSRAKAKEFRDTATTFRGASSWRSNIGAEQWKLIPDLEHAAEYIENTILVLEARQRGENTTSERAAALAYFEWSYARTAKDFTFDLKSIIEQTEASLALAEKGENPYGETRHGDIRRAIYSKSTGVLEPYRIFVPEAYTEIDSIPLILMLHGGGGDENYFADLDGGSVKKVLSERPYIMLSPKCTSWYWGPGAADLKQLIEETLKAYPKVDPSRIYCTGVSAGGGGTFRLAMAYPDLFRGIACVSSGPQVTNDIERLGALPLLMLHGGKDIVSPVERAHASAAALEERGYSPFKLYVFPEYGHEYHAVEYLELTLDFFEKHL